jgi:hypothetical protein
MASLLDLASGYPGMKVFTGVKAIIEKMSVQRATMIVTKVTKRLVFVN